MNPAILIGGGILVVFGMIGILEALLERSRTRHIPPPEAETIWDVQPEAPTRPGFSPLLRSLVLFAVGALLLWLELAAGERR